MAKQYTLLIDLDRCVGCMACMVACKVVNQVDTGVDFNQVYKVGPEGTFPDCDMFFFPKQCMHCVEPLCAQVCPSRATYKTEEGVVLVDHNRCFGCSYCIWACPYGARTLNKNKGMVEKCVLCLPLVQKGEKPECVKTCLGNCRIFGDINDPNSEVSKYYTEQSDRAMQIHPEIGTKPSVIYFKPRKGAAKL
ncbi:Tetrathionate reductase subunit B precursor [Sporomusa ovata DSM 2662]|uniref:Molybdopterin oxidoreductase, iron-sulfur binding subunit n=1 Tax=Sporomusa ovata TaxID=2378 RepID=A0A0U1KXN6_9FIRM|nr:4Fe-4S dicluster domain-containing protein [Sporomusa ovata]EQB28673.1 Fe-S-cluster-containing hydrogenase subunit [Sporomusa ovata DSM 2662]CQR72182.1 molybdopterin oxidoreductase, iron-sulfur binding subunit [Sporomusa ovata]